MLDRILRGAYRPHRRLLDHTARVIAAEPTFVLLDEQQVVFNTILAKVRGRHLGAGQTVFLVLGGPGTGKSVLAVNLLAELSRQGHVTQHVTGSKAFTENLRKVVGSRASAQFGYFNGFATAEPGAIDVLICDEAHRLRETSVNRFTAKTDRSGRPQIEELLVAAKTSVFFIDDMQVVRPGEVGSSELIRSSAAAMGIPLVEMELEAQFRCSGSDAYIQWVENTLDLRRTPHVLWDASDPFDFDVVDSLEELEGVVRGKAAEGFTARLAAGFCWPWSDPRPDGTLVSDVTLERLVDAVEREARRRAPRRRRPQVELLGPGSRRARAGRLHLHGARVRVRLRGGDLGSRPRLSQPGRVGGAAGVLQGQRCPARRGLAPSSSHW